MTRISVLAALLFTAISPLLVQTPLEISKSNDELWHHRNLGKAFYENPTTHQQAEGEFAKAVALANSLRDHVNYGLALLRVGKFDQAIEELQRAQQLERAQPAGSRLLHILFSLGIAYKKKADTSG